MSSSASGSSGGSRAPTTDELLQNLLDSVSTPSPAPVATTAQPAASASSAPPATAAVPSDQSVSSTADTPAAASKSAGGGSAGLSVGLAVGAVLLVAVVVLFFRQRKRRRRADGGSHRPLGYDNDLGTPQFSIELPRPPHLDDSGGSARGGKRASEVRISVFSSVQNGGETAINAAGELGPSSATNHPHASAQLYRVSNQLQTGPAITTFHMDPSPSSTAVSANPVPDSAKTTKLTRVLSGRVPAEFGSPGRLPVPAANEGGGSLPRDTNASAVSINSLHDSMCGDFFTHGDGLGDRIRAKSRAKAPSMVEEEDESSGRSQNPMSFAASQQQQLPVVTVIPLSPPAPAPASVPAASTQRSAATRAPPTPKHFAATPATPVAVPKPQVVVLAPSTAVRRPPPPPPPATADFVNLPPPVAVSSDQMYRPSTESEIAFQRLSTVSTDSLGSVKRVSTSSAESASDARAGSMIEINEIVSVDGSQVAKEIEI